MPDKKDAERRAYNFEIRAEQTERGTVLTGRPVVYDSRTDIGPFDEIIMPGALDGCDLTDVPFLVNHDTQMIPLARSRRNNANSTMKMAVDDKGLLLERILLDTEHNEAARSLASAVERGDVDGMSFMFAVADDSWDGLDTDHPTRRVRKISKVFEVSACTWPAYDATEIHARNTAALDSARAALDSARAQDDELALAKAKTQTLLLS